jgi:ssDNA-binding Zn-finger/Zn-ribbon topoisomerase 1
MTDSSAEQEDRELVCFDCNYTWVPNTKRLGNLWAIQIQCPKCGREMNAGKSYWINAMETGIDHMLEEKGLK